MKSVCLISLGCPKNLVDSEVILGVFSRAGYSITTEPSEAEILIVNTCAFIEDATKEAIETILRLTHYKKEDPCKLLIVSGCLPQRYGKVLEKEFPEVDIFVGTGAFHKLPKLLSQKRKKKTFIPPSTFLYNERTPRILSTPPFTAYLKIAEGCSKSCTFCTVPKIKGPYKSRRLNSVINEAKELASRGVKELILIAQDTTAYGEDLGDGTNLMNLLKNLVKIDSLHWIRILYTYPKIEYFVDELLELIAKEEKICPYIDLPIQHIDDEILRRMGRKSNEYEIKKLIEKIRNFVPEVSLRTSLIVGFPGEGEKQFKKLMDFVREIRFDHLGVFKYSPEQGTPAFRLPNQIEESLKEERFRAVMELQKDISLKKYQELVGKRMEALVEKYNQSGVKLGRLKIQSPDIDGCIFLQGEACQGEFVEAKITRALPYDLFGQIIRVSS
jgi:ribosomal protein S12 methylthiotransferase